MFTKYELEEKVKKDGIKGQLMVKINNVWEFQSCESKLVTRSTKKIQWKVDGRDWNEIRIPFSKWLSIMNLISMYVVKQKNLEEFGSRKFTI